MAATRKTEKHSTLSSAYRFEPIAVENLGVFSFTTLNFISELGRRICVDTRDARETSYLFQRISIILQRFNSVLLHDTLPVDLQDLWPSDILILAFLLFNPGDLYYLGYLKNQMICIIFRTRDPEEISHIVICGMSTAAETRSSAIAEWPRDASCQ